MRVNCRDGPATDGEEPGQTAEASSRSGTDEEGTLVGTVEVSVAASTRTRFLTLNAPEVIHLYNGPSPISLSAPCERYACACQDHTQCCFLAS